MTEEESRAIYDDLCESWYAREEPSDLEQLQRWRLQTILAVRQAMARLSEKRT